MRLGSGLRLVALVFVVLVLQGCNVIVRAPVHPAPPAHAPAYGYHHDDFYYEYYYYPSAQVYFHIYTGYYYYYTGHRWVRTRVLPSHFRLYARDRYKFTQRAGRPYERHEYYRKEYRPRPELKYDRRQDQRERERLNKRYDEYRHRRTEGTPAPRFEMRREEEKRGGYGEREYRKNGKGKDRGDRDGGYKKEDKGKDKGRSDGDDNDKRFRIR